MMEKIRRAAAGLAACLLLTSCAGPAESGGAEPNITTGVRAQSGYLSVARYETGNVDPQCNSEDLTIALNVFDRLLEAETGTDGNVRLVPSLAESWQISDDGLEYTFRLRKDVTFSNGTLLTATDVRYSLTRLLTHPESCYREIALPILGAEEVAGGEESILRGVTIHHAFELSVRLSEPYAPFLAGLASPGASILDEETAEKAGRVFGREPSCTIGTGPFIFEDWKPGLEMTLRANPDCWAGAPRCAGIHIHLVSDSESQRLLFENGTLDVLDLDDWGTDAEYFYRSDVYKRLLRREPRVCLNFIALNNAAPPLDDVRVRKALQLALDRKTLLTAVAGGRGEVESGLLPWGMTGHNYALAEIPFDLERARALLDEAGLADGFDLALTLPEGASQSVKDLMEMAAVMWERIGVRAELTVIDDSVFLARRNAGTLSCYAEHWSAGYSDPDHFLSAYFGTEENTARRSVFYQNEAVMARLARARALPDEKARVREYRLIERMIAQEDAACIPLFSVQHCSIVNERVEGLKSFWNGASDGCYRNVTVRE